MYDDDSMIMAGKGSRVKRSISLRAVAGLPPLLDLWDLARLALLMWRGGLDGHIGASRRDTSLGLDRGISSVSSVLKHFLVGF